MPSAETPAGDDTAAPTAPFIPPPPFPWRAVSRSVLLAAVLALSCAIALDFAQIHLLKGLHVDPQPFERYLAIDFTTALAALLLAPLIETLAMAAGIGLLRKASRSRAFVIAASGALWGAVHGTSGLLAALPTGASFAIFTALYLRWRPHSFAAAYWSTAWAHALYNTTWLAIAFFLIK